MYGSFSLLVDPELVHSAEEFRNDKRYLARLCALAAYKDLSVGPKTARFIGEFLQWLAVDREESKRLFSNMGPSEPLAIFAPLARINSLPTGDYCRQLDVEACGYTPHFGAPENVFALQSDLDVINIKDVVLLTDDECWPFRSDCFVCAEWPLRYARCEKSQHMVWRLRILDEIFDSGDCRSLASYAQLAFPNIVFSDCAISSFTCLRVQPHGDAKVAVEHLAVLNDFAPSIWKEHPVRNDRVARMAALGVACSPEGKNTRKNHGKMSQRDYPFGDEKVRCEWHTKVHHNRGRIHFCVCDEKVFVGAYERHLET